MNHPLHLHPHLAAQRRFRRSPAGSRPGGFLCFPGKHPCDRPSVYPKPFQHPVAAGTKPTPRTNAASSVTFYADAQSLSPNYLSSVVRAKSGRTAIQWIEIITIIHAQHYLVSTKLSIKEVAEKLNFPDQSTFGRYFKKHAGMSPKEYKKKIYM